MTNEKAITGVEINRLAIDLLQDLREDERFAQLDGPDLVYVLDSASGMMAQLMKRKIRMFTVSSLVILRPPTNEK